MFDPNFNSGEKKSSSSTRWLLMGVAALAIIGMGIKSCRRIERMQQQYRPHYSVPRFSSRELKLPAARLIFHDQSKPTNQPTINEPEK